ncbi:MAG TPA: molybdate ABC transporter substrate-binding protein [Stellaceae bacterium]|nr:molybdate ABC transporter substrate-binding protein [Stellaceae bacterium]
MHKLRCLIAAFALLAGFVGVAAKAAELKVVSAGAMRAVLQQLAPSFEAATGNHLVLEFSTAGGVEQRVAGGDAIDVAVLTRSRLDKLAQQGKVAAPSVVTLARASIGLAVRKGTPHPDIASVDAFKRALLNAKSIAYTDPASGGTSGIHLAQVLERLGIAAALKPKIHLVSATAATSSPSVGEAIAKGEAEIGLQPISELISVEGIDIVGPIPSELQSAELVYAAGAPVAGKQKAAAKALIDYLAGPTAAPVLKAKGLMPG